MKKHSIERINLIYKTCIKCNKEYPSSHIFFRRHIKYKDGLNSTCKICHRELTNMWISDKKCLSSYIGAKNRCTNKNNKDYKRYGALGIKFKFESYDSFIKHIGQRPDGTTLDRIDNNGDYDYGNVKWSTPKQQAQNRKNTKLNEEERKEIFRLVSLGKDKKEISKNFNISLTYVYTINQRLGGL